MAYTQSRRNRRLHDTGVCICTCHMELAINAFFAVGGPTDLLDHVRQNPMAGFFYLLYLLDAVRRTTADATNDIMPKQVP